MSVLSKLLAILGLVTRLLDLWREHRARRQAVAESESESLRKQAIGRKVADEIDRSVASTDLDALRERMRNYQRD
ncbi:hypothetical protein [Azorhizobium caulinodans]|uniref:hypothetical protein n=1 Tax=Azorhizobium caulinodans TaxID=7 RepID=UPI00068BC9F2|nr:hypothetical protein [Azorhizobium caulinodans]